MVAVVSLCCVMMLTPDSSLLKNPKPNFVYASGLASFLEVLKINGKPLINPVLAVSFGLLAFTTFVYDTLDVSTRLGRYILQELLGWHGRWGRWVATGITAAVPLFFVTRRMTDAAGKEIPAWQAFWNLFGASNQLLAALTLLGITVWLWRTKRSKVGLAVTGLPAVWMYIMSVWALIRMIDASVKNDHTASDPVFWGASVLVALAALMLGEAVLVFARGGRQAESGNPNAQPGNA